MNVLTLNNSWSEKKGRRCIN